MELKSRDLKNNRESELIDGLLLLLVTSRIEPKASFAPRLARFLLRTTNYHPLQKVIRHIIEYHQNILEEN